MVMLTNELGICKGQEKTIEEQMHKHAMLSTDA